MAHEESEVNIKLLNLARSGNGVRRYHTVHNPGTVETVGHHTAGVIGILFCLYNQKPPIELIEAALYHDSSECVMGDIPATAKWDFPDMELALEVAEVDIMKAAGYVPKLELEQVFVLKFADLMDLCFKCSQEALAGNREMHAVFHNGLVAAGNLLRENLKEFKNAHDLFNTFLEDTKRATKGQR